MTLAYSYLRFSTSEQALGDSSRRQSEAARLFAAEHDLELDDRLRLQDRGVSGYHGDNVRRGALGQFLAAIDSGSVEKGSYLLVENLDRMSRQNPWDAMPVFQQIINSGVTIVTLQDNRIWSKSEMQAHPFRIFESLMVMIRANEESATKARRLTAAWSNKRANAGKKIMTARAPAWLRVTQNREFEVIEERATIVRRIYAEASSGIGQNKIAACLNLQGVTVFEDGKCWHRSYIAKLLRNPATIGTLIPHTQTHDDVGRKIRTPQDPVMSYYPAIVDLDTFAAVQSLHGSNPCRGRHAGSGIRNVLGGLARCARCGSTMTRAVKGSRSKPIYVCTGAKTGSGCEYRPVHVEVIEAALSKHLSEFDDQEELTVPGVRTLRYTITAPANSLEMQMKQTYGEEKQAQSRIDRITDLVADGNASPALLTKLASLETQLSWIRDMRAALRAKFAEVNSPAAMMRRLRFKEAMTCNPLDYQAANVAARQWLDGAVIDPNESTLVLQVKTGQIEKVVFEPLPSSSLLTKQRLMTTQRSPDGRLLPLTEQPNMDGLQAS